MKSRPSLPDQRNYEYAYELAYKLACEQLAKIDDIEQQCYKAGAQYQTIDSQKVINIKYLNQAYVVTLPKIDVSLADSEEKVPVRDKVLILHYLAQAKGTPSSNKLTTYKEMAGGNVYFPTFLKRTVNPLLKYFGREPHLLVDVARRLGGYQVEQGDVAVTISAFSRVPITLVLWQGDDEFGPDGSIIFDANISDYLSTEDITVLCETVTWRLINHLREPKPFSDKNLRPGGGNGI
jgi:hypothetical protein